MNWDTKAQDEIWDADAAQMYDRTDDAMFSSEVLTPTTDRLAALAGDGRALEFAIGTGRVAIPLAARGVPVVGIEYSRHMIDRLREKVDEATIPAVQGDMSTTHVDGEFSLVYLVFNTISNLLEQDQQVECFRNAAHHLNYGGHFVIELWVPTLRTLPPGLDASVGRVQDGYIVLDTIDTVTQRLVSHHIRFGEGRDARLDRTPLRYIWPAELDLMGRLAGFELESRDSDWKGTEFTSKSTSHVSVYRKVTHD
jgi:SAM-dependent methyltransferase